MADRTLCRYHLQGACKYGQKCMFSHDIKNDAPSMVCKYYLAGHCAYGDGCRYDHVKPEWSQRAKNSSRPTVPPPPVVPKPHVDFTSEGWPTAGGDGDYSEVQQHYYHGAADEQQQWGYGDGAGGSGHGQYDDDTGTGGGHAAAPWLSRDPWGVGPDPGSSSGGEDDEGRHAFGSSGGGGAMTLEQQLAELGILTDDGDGSAGEESAAAAAAAAAASLSGGSGSGGGGGPPPPLRNPAVLPLCAQFSSFGSCAKGDACPLVHGTLCDICGRPAVHPYNEAAAEQHRSDCRRRHDKLAARLASADVECAICMERVLQNAGGAGDRRFGLMACEHPFCLNCIRQWRTNTEVDIEAAGRTCPICRTTTYFVTPSSVWPRSAEEKAAIVDGYKSRLSDLDCRLYDRGAGTCPFGTSCFYRHMNKDGSLQDRSTAGLRKAATAEGEVRILAPITLSTFLDTRQAQRLLAAGSSGSSSRGAQRGRGARRS